MSTPTPIDLGAFRAGPTILLPPSRLSPSLVMVTDPASSVAEQYRLLALAVERAAGQSGRQKGAFVVAVSSALASEGKTVTALNLAFALAENKNLKTCLCDADLKRGRIAESLGLGPSAGLAEVLEGKRTLAEVLRKIEKNLGVLSSGESTSGNNTLSLLRGPAWREALLTLKGHFDYVVLDCPPLCVSDDMTVLVEFVDRTLLVVRSGATTAEAVRDALAKVPSAKSFGFVLNDAPITRKSYRPYKREF